MVMKRSPHCPQTFYCPVSASTQHGGEATQMQRKTNVLHFAQVSVFAVEKGEATVRNSFYPLAFYTAVGSAGWSGRVAM